MGTNTIIVIQSDSTEAYNLKEGPLISPFAETQKLPISGFEIFCVICVNIVVFLLLLFYNLKDLRAHLKLLMLCVLGVLIKIVKIL